MQRNREGFCYNKQKPFFIGGYMKKMLLLMILLQSFASAGLVIKNEDGTESSISVRLERIRKLMAKEQERQAEREKAVALLVANAAVFVQRRQIVHNLSQQIVNVIRKSPDGAN